MSTKLGEPEHQAKDAENAKAPDKDRDAPGKGFTHHVADVVTIACDRLGSLTNVVAYANVVVYTELALPGLSASARLCAI